VIRARNKALGPAYLPRCSTLPALGPGASGA